MKLSIQTSNLITLILIVMIVFTIPVTVFALLGVAALMFGITPNINPLCLYGYDVLVAILAPLWFRG